MVDIPKDVPSHKHCVICGKSISIDKEFCSQKCEEDYSRIVKRRKRSNYLMIALLVVMMAILFVPALLA